MEYGTVFITERLWREIDKDLRRELLKVMPRKMYVGRYAGNVYNDLWIRHRGDLAMKLDEEIGTVLSVWGMERGYYPQMYGEYIGEPKKTKGKAEWKYLESIHELLEGIGSLTYKLWAYYYKIADILEKSGLEEMAEKVRRSAEKLWDLEYDLRLSLTLVISDRLWERGRMAH